MRERGELYAVRSERDDEWLYPAWQFGPGGKVPRGVNEVVSAARRRASARSASSHSCGAASA